MGTLGDMGCFSISAYKIVGGGEGGCWWRTTCGFSSGRANCASAVA